jgi:hypothetical protein
MERKITPGMVDDTSSEQERMPVRMTTTTSYATVKKMIVVIVLLGSFMIVASATGTRPSATAAATALDGPSLTTTIRNQNRFHLQSFLHRMLFGEYRIDELAEESSGLQQHQQQQHDDGNSRHLSGTDKPAKKPADTPPSIPPSPSPSPKAQEDAIVPSVPALDGTSAVPVIPSEVMGAATIPNTADPTSSIGKDGTPVAVNNDASSDSSPPTQSPMNPTSAPPSSAVLSCANMTTCDDCIDEAHGASAHADELNTCIWTSWSCEKVTKANVTLPQNHSSCEGTTIPLDPKNGNSNDDETHGGSGTGFVVFLLLLGVGGGAYYFKDKVQLPTAPAFQGGSGSAPLRLGGDGRTTKYEQVYVCEQKLSFGGPILLLLELCLEVCSSRSLSRVINHELNYCSSL